MNYIIAILTSISCIIIANIYNNMNISNLCELDKCPYCYGTSFCGNISSVRLSFTLLSLLSHFSVKNVFYGRFNNVTVVIKKLAHTSELNRAPVIEDEDNVKESIVNYIVANQSDGEIRPLRVCSRKASIRLVDWYINLKPAGVALNDHLKNLWTIVVVNAEPFMLQLLNEENDWPVPEYFGSCGRLIIENNRGQNLASVSNLAWIDRAKIAVQLLELAEKFTDGHKYFRFYLTDVSPDNIAVDLQGTVTFIDLENVIISEKNNKGTIHHSKNFDDEDFAFSVDEVCGSSISDHNYYAVCKLLLSKYSPWPMMQGGILHSPPSHQMDLDEIFNYIELCVQPSLNVSRFEAHKHTMKMLKQILR